MQALEVAVEDIFQIAAKNEASPRTTEAVFLGDLELALPRNPLRLCSVNGPQEKPGKIHVRFSGVGACPRSNATNFIRQRAVHL